MKKLVGLLFIFLLAGCTVQTETVYVVDDETKAQLLEQLRNELKDEFKIEYQPSLSEIENMIASIIDLNSDAFIGVSNYQKRADNTYGLTGTGSGVIYEYDNDNGYYYAITNAHVVDNADRIEIVLENGNTIQALGIWNSQVFIADKQSDIAVVRFAYDQPLKVAQFADSDDILKGQMALAMGNPLGYDYFGTVTFGVVSGLARGIDIDYDNDNTIDWKATLIQHDVAISPGNSGGPLFNLNGQVIGINNMKVVEENVSGIGFAIPSNTAIEIAGILREKGKISRAQLGITGNDLKTLRTVNDPEIQIPTTLQGGIYIMGILEDGSVDGSGIKKGDIIIGYNGIDIVDFDDLRFALDNSYAGDKVELRVYRLNQELTFTITLKEKPAV